MKFTKNVPTQEALLFINYNITLEPFVITNGIICVPSIDTKYLSSMVSGDEIYISNKRRDTDYMKYVVKKISRDYWSIQSNTELSPKDTNELGIREVFDNLYDSVKTYIPFDPNWNNGTGYFDGSVMGKSAISLPVKHFAISEDYKGRKLLFHGTVDGTICMFYRYPDCNADRITWNATRDLSARLRSKLVDRAITVRDLSVITSME